MRAPRGGQSGMQLTPDFTIILQVAIFIVVWLGLRSLVFEPTQQVLAERRRRTVEAHENAEGMMGAAQADRPRQAAAAESDAHIEAARAQIAAELASHRATVAAQVEQARRTLSAEAQTIATEMLQRVTGAKWG